MPVTTSNLWKGEPNTKVPAISHYFSYRVTGAVFNANGTTAFNLPANYTNVGQNAVVSGNPAASAPSASPYDANSEPMYIGSVFVPTHVMIRSPNGQFVGSGASAAGTATIALYNPNVASINDLTGAVTRTAGTAANGVNTYALATWTASTTGNQVWTTESLWELNVCANSVDTATPALTSNPNLVAVAVAETASSVPGLVVTPVRFGLGDSLAVSVTIASYAAGATTTAACTAFTVDTFGYWIQTI